MRESVKKELKFGVYYEQNCIEYNLELQLEV